MPHAMPIFDTLKSSDALQAAGVPEPQAGEQIKHLQRMFGLMIGGLAAIALRVYFPAT